MLDDPTNEDAARDEAVRELIENVGADAEDDGENPLADGFGSETYSGGTTNRPGSPAGGEG